MGIITTALKDNRVQEERDGVKSIFPLRKYHQEKMLTSLFLECVHYKSTLHKAAEGRQRSPVDRARDWDSGDLGTATDPLCDLRQVS